MGTVALQGCHWRQDATEGATWSWPEVVLHISSPLLGGLCCPGWGFCYWVGCWSSFSGAADSYRSCYCDPTTWMARRPSCRHRCHDPGSRCFEHMLASQDPLQGRTVESLATSLRKRWGCLDS